MLSARSVNNQVCFGELRAQPGIQRKRLRSALEPFYALGRRQRRQTLPIVFGQGTLDEEHVRNPVAPLGVDDLRFARQDATVPLERHEKGIRAIGHVVDEARRKAHQRAVVVYPVVEPPLAQEIRPGKDEIADGAVGKLERPSGVELAAHGFYTLANRRSPFRCHRCEGLHRLLPGARIRQSRVEELDQPLRARAKLARHAGGIFSKVGRTKAVAEEAPHFPCRRAVVVTVDGNRQRDVGMFDELTREDVRSSSAREEHYADHYTLSERGRGSICEDSHTSRMT